MQRLSMIQLAVDFLSNLAQSANIYLFHVAVGYLSDYKDESDVYAVNHECKFQAF